jgi:hypothetical protein
LDIVIKRPNGSTWLLLGTIVIENGEGASLPAFDACPATKYSGNIRRIAKSVFFICIIMTFHIGIVVRTGLTTRYPATLDYDTGQVAAPRKSIS